MPSDDAVAEKVTLFQQAWRPYESKIPQALAALTGLNFRKNIIDVYVAPHFWAFSDPLVIGWSYTPERFTTVLTHELAHVILTDNTLVSYDAPLLNRWQRLFGKEHDVDTLIHIPVHGLLQGVFEGALHEPQRIKEDVASCHSNGSYISAWNYVKTVGYSDVITKLAEDYQAFALEDLKLRHEG